MKRMLHVGYGAVALATAAMLTGCAVEYRETHHAHGGVVVSEEVIVAGPPPPPRVEVVTVAPSPQHIWIKGYWVRHGDWVWTPGHWEARPHPRAVWVEGTWKHDHRGWVRVEGHWRD